MDEKAVFEEKELTLGPETWIAKVENDPGASAYATDLRVFKLVLRRKDAHATRHLTVLASHAGIQVENHVLMLHQCVRDFLQTGEAVGEVSCFGLPAAPVS